LNALFLALMLLLSPLALEFEGVEFDFSQVGGAARLTLCLSNSSVIRALNVTLTHEAWPVLGERYTLEWRGELSDPMGLAANFSMAYDPNATRLWLNATLRLDNASVGMWRLEILVDTEEAVYAYGEAGVSRGFLAYSEDLAPLFKLRKEGAPYPVYCSRPVDLSYERNVLRLAVYREPREEDRLELLALRGDVAWMVVDGVWLGGPIGDREAFDSTDGPCWYSEGGVHLVKLRHEAEVVRQLGREGREEVEAGMAPAAPEERVWLSLLVENLPIVVSLGVTCFVLYLYYREARERIV